LNAERFPLAAKTVFGLEGVLADELIALGAEAVVPGRRIVDFNGDRRLLYAANIRLRTAIRVLKPIHRFNADSPAALYEGIQQIDWAAYLQPSGSLAIDPVVHSSFATHSLFVAQRAKDAIVDQFRDRTGIRPAVDLQNPDLRINLHLNENRATLYLDSSGDSLHKRGYRAAGGEAPLNEVLAAGILRLSQWDRRRPLVDIMCGSGTLPIEAALWARNIAPGRFRSRFGYMRWLDFDAALHEQLLGEARRDELPALDFPIVGSDLDPQAVALAQENARRAGVDRDVRFEVAHYEAARPPAPGGQLVLNPPYGQRMAVERIEPVYRRIGAALAEHWPGYTAWVLAASPETTPDFGLRVAKKFRLNNGPIHCRLLRFDLDERAAARVARAAVERAVQAATAFGARATGAARSPATAVPARRQWQAQAQEFQNRLVRMAKHWKKWARRQGITCFRLYDRDMPEVPLAIDWYEGHLHVAEYVRPHDRTEVEHAMWLERMLEIAAEALAVEPQHIELKRRRRQRGKAQYERTADEGRRLVVQEGGHRLEVNLSDYLDTGLFLDHRLTRAMVEREAQGKRFLNLFGYTGAFTVYAAAGGAAETTTVDLSQTYLDWCRRNLQLNGFDLRKHHLLREDALSYLRRLPQRRGGAFDLAVVDPPTFSNSKATQLDWDVARDHPELLNLVLRQMAAGGKIYFSTNFRRFKLRPEEIFGATIHEISRQTVPPDFRNKRIHRCWILRKTDASGGD
jgi:23S rRNA (guanine2445-N2)-methyltransferase / 23S rRNA (guanine2069-N7)-methyltransferase